MHGFEGGSDKIAVVADGDVAPGGEGEGAVDDHFFAGGFAEGFGPFELSETLVGSGKDGNGGGWTLRGFLFILNCRECQ